MAKLIGKLAYSKGYKKLMFNGFEAVEYDILKCEVENIGYYKAENCSHKYKDTIVKEPYVAFDIPSGLMVCKTKYKRDLANEVNKLKEKIELARSKESYIQKVKDLQNAIMTNKNTKEEDK